MADLISEISEILMIKKDVQGAVDHVKKALSSLLQNKTDLYKLIITKAYTKKAEEYKVTVIYAHMAYFLTR